MSSVRVVAVTQPVIRDDDGELISTAEFIAYVARVSNPANQMNHATGPKLLKFLRDNKHWSPFQMGHATLEIVTTRAIARQILRHRSFAFQEFSQRYAKATNFIVEDNARLQDTKNRQNSFDTDDQDLRDWWLGVQNEIRTLVEEHYVSALDKGMAKEVARNILPEGMTESKLYMAGSLRDWYHYCELRCGNGTQKEHRAVALDASKCLAEFFPGLFNFHLEAEQSNSSH